MSRECEKIHELVNAKRRHRFPFVKEEIPDNGISVMFEEGEEAHGGSRIVWVGTHSQPDRLPGRLQDHLRSNKDGSILRKSIGGALLAARADRYAEAWELNTSSREQRSDPRVDAARQREIEAEVTSFIEDRLSFTVLPFDSVADRAFYQAKLLATIAQCSACEPSEQWPGIHSPSEKIRTYGLWQVQRVRGQPFTATELVEFMERIPARDRGL